MASAKQLLKEAMLAIKEENYDVALRSCFQALSIDSSLLEAHLFAGKAHFMLKSYERAVASYSKAAELNPSAAPPLQGLREVYLAQGPAADRSLIPVLQKLVAMTDDVAKKASFLRELYAAQDRTGALVPAYDSIQQLLALPGAPLEASDRADLIVTCADLLWRDLEGGHAPHPNLVPALEAVLSLQSGVGEDVLTAAAERRLCCCDTAEALYVTAVEAVLPRLSRISQALIDWTVRAAELVALSKPDIASANLYSTAHLSPVLHDSFTLILDRFAGRCGLEGEGVLQAVRLSLDPAEASAVPAYILPSTSFVLARTFLDKGRPTLALSALDLPPPLPSPAFLNAPSPLLPEFSLLRAECLLALQRVPESEAKFQEAVKMRGDIEWRLRALQGLAWGYLSTGNTDNALKVAAKAEDLAGRESSLSPAVAALHRAWIAGVRGRQLQLEGDLQEAELQLSTALEAAAAAAGHVSPQLTAQLQLWRGKVRLSLGGDRVSDRSKAFVDFKASAEVEGPCRGDALAGLASVLLAAGDAARAQKCLERAVQLDPTSESAGTLLCSLLRSNNAANGNAEEIAVLQRVIASSDGAATWAQRRLAALHATSGDHRAAVDLLWALLRKSPRDAVLWETLGASFFSLRQLQPALRAFTKAAELDPAHAQEVLVYRHLMCGEVCVSLGQVPESEPFFRKAAALEPSNAAVLFSLARALHKCAARHIELGAHGTAVRELQEALDLLRRANRCDPTLASVHKLQGDVLQLLSSCSTRSLGAAQHEDGQQGEYVESHLAVIQQQLGWLAEARRSYAKSVFRQPAPSTSAHTFSDAAQALVTEAHLRRNHASLDSDGRYGNRLRSHAAGFLQRLLHLPQAATSPEVWHNLGVAALDPRLKEYAFSRSLQLDASRAATWIALGQLYEGAGELEHANKCFEEARCHEAESGETWEAMGQQMTSRWGARYAADAVAAEGPDPIKARAEVLKERKARFDLDEIAISLWGGGGFLSNLWRALDAAALGRGTDVASVASAERAADFFPLSPLAHVALGVSWEGAAKAEGSRSQVPLQKAEHAYRTARQLLQDPGVPGFGDTDLEPLVSEFVLHLRPSNGSPTLSDRDVALALVDVNLARVLVAQGKLGEAADAYGSLEAAGLLPSSLAPSAPSPLPYTVLSGAYLSRAACALGLDDVDGAKQHLLSAVGWVGGDATLTVQTLASAAVLSADHDLDQSLMFLFQLTEHLASAKEQQQAAAAEQGVDPYAVAARAWSAVLEKAGMKGQTEGVLLAAIAWAKSETTCREASVDGARFCARASLLDPSSGFSSRRIGRAVFTCPWASDVRETAVRGTLAASSSRNGSLSTERLPSLLPPAPAKSPEIFAMQLATCPSGVRGQGELKGLVSRAASRVVADPSSLSWRLLHALSLIHLARASSDKDGSARAVWEKALKSVTTALQLTKSLGLTGTSPDQVEVLVLLLVASSDCHLHTDSLAQAASFADKALMLASRMSGAPAAASRALAHLAKARCALRHGQTDEAASLYNATLSLPKFAVPCAIQGAAELLAFGQGAAALQLLESASSATGSTEESGESEGGVMTSLALLLSNVEVMRFASEEGPTMSGLYVEGLSQAIRGAADLSPAQLRTLEVASGILTARLASDAYRDPAAYEAMGIRAPKELAQQARRLLRSVSLLGEGHALLGLGKAAQALVEELRSGGRRDWLSG